MGQIKHEFLEVQLPKIEPPPCIKGGQAPCPTCPVRGRCEWGKQVMRE